MKKRIISSFLAAVMVVSMAVPVSAAENNIEIEGNDSNQVIEQEIPELEENNEYYELDENGEAIESNYSEEIKINENADEITIDAAGLEPRYYPIAGYPKVKPDVWKKVEWPMDEAFAYIAAAEIQAYKRGINVDLSEVALEYFNWNPVQDPLGLMSDDRNETAGGHHWYNGLVVNQPGFVNRSLAKWVGPVDESVMPFSGMSEYAKGNGLPNIQYSVAADKFHLQNWEEFKLYVPEDIPRVKQWIKDKGSVVVQYSRFLDFYNKATNSYYYFKHPDSSEPVNTASVALIVGWDDNYSKDNFYSYYENDDGSKIVGKPEKNGAWLMRASSSDGYVGQDYFWISYEDNALSGLYDKGNDYKPSFGSAYGLDFEDASNYKYNYQYDGANSNQNIAVNMELLGANVFIAATNDPLTAVGAEFFISPMIRKSKKAEQNYKIKVYKNCDANKPDSGQLVSTVQGTVERSGYKTIKLPSPVPMTAGTRFSVVLELSNSVTDMANCLVAEGNFNNVYSDEFRYRVTAKAKPGQSFWKRGRIYIDGREYDLYDWEDVTKHNQTGNLRIKAYTGGAGGNNNNNSNLPFTDVDANKWYYNAVKYVYDNKIMSGTSATTFQPTANTTREMMVTIVYNTAGKPATNYNGKFKDVPNGKWFSTAVSWAVNNGITSGKSANSFGVGESVTREQVAVFLYNFAKFQGKDVSAQADLGKFADAGNVSSWAKTAMSWANAKGIINGSNGRLNPKGNATRAEIAQMIMGYKTK